jgi:predicted nicotinamide N-methyase
MYNYTNRVLHDLHAERYKRLSEKSQTKSYTVKCSSKYTTLTIREQPGLELGSISWPGASILADYIQNNSHLVRNKSVLELGSGPGVPGLVCSAVGASQVVLSDQKNLCSLMQENINLNQQVLSNISSIELDWFSSQHVGTFNVIIGSDIVYNNDVQVFDALIETLHNASDLSTVVYLSYRQRDSKESYFFDQISKEWICEQVHHVIQENKPQTIFKLSRKTSTGESRTFT